MSSGEEPALSAAEFASRVRERIGRAGSRSAPQVRSQMDGQWRRILQDMAVDGIADVRTVHADDLEECVLTDPNPRDLHRTTRDSWEGIFNGVDTRGDRLSVAVELYDDSEEPVLFRSFVMLMN